MEKAGQGNGMAAAITVSQLNRQVKTLLEKGLARLWVEGEISNIARPASGHVYFSLKDASAQIRCAFFRQRQRGPTIGLKNGDQVLAFGRVSLYEPRGDYQLIVEQVEPAGEGALKRQFEVLKKKLAAEGLFDEDRKQLLPDLPERIGVITSPSGAAVRDILTVLGRRFPSIPVVIYPAAVQGEAAPAELVAALQAAIQRDECDVLIIGRGGGSLEDLWAFNDEGLARAIADCPIPVVSGVGHEVDFTIADFVADIRATTPTQAAELIVARLEEQARRVADARALLLRDLDRKLSLARTRLDGLAGSSGLARVPHRVRLLSERLRRALRLRPALKRVLVTAESRLELALRGLQRLPARIAAGGHRRVVISRKEQLSQLMAARIAQIRARIAAGERALTHLGPSKVLERGYSITCLEGSPTPLRDAARVHGGQTLVTRLARGEVRSLVRNATSTPKPAADAPARQPTLFDTIESPAVEPGD